MGYNWFFENPELNILTWLRDDTGSDFGLFNPEFLGRNSGGIHFDTST